MTATGAFGNDNDPAWYLLATFTLSGAPEDHRLVTDWLKRALQRLNWPAATLAQLEQAVFRAMTDVFKKAEAAGLLLVRLFVRAEGEPADPLTAARVGRGWGFFLVQKGANSGSRPSATPHHVIEVFLYQE